MGKWEMVRLGDVASYVNGFAFKPEDWSIQGLPIIRIQNLTESRNEVNYYAKSDKNKYEINDGDVLISWSASLGVYEWSKGRALLNQHIFKVVFDKLKINKKYFIHVITHLLKDMSKETHGSTMKHITKSRFDNMQIPLPPLETQQKIAATLDTAAAVLKLRQQQLAELEALIQSVFYQMFGDPVRNEKGWEKELLKKMCTKLTDGTHFSPPNNVVGDYKYVTAKNIKQHGLDLSNISYISEADHKSIYSRCNPEKGDVLYIKDGATTGIAVVNTLSEEFSLLSSVALLKHDRRRIEGSFLKVILNNKNMKSKIREDMGGAAITRLTLTKISNIQIPVPPLPLQTQFAAIVQKIDQQKALVQQSIDETQTLFDSLMSQYFD